MGSWSVFSEGDALYGEMLRDIAKASHSVRIESYILVADQIGTRFLSELAQAASRGVSVAMRVDHAGSFFTLPHALIRGLRASGVDFRWSRRWTWRYPWRLNRPLHLNAERFFYQYYCLASDSFRKSITFISMASNPRSSAR